MPGSQAASESTQQLIDAEVRRIVDEAYAGVTQLITEHRAQLDSLTDKLLSDETLDEDAAYAAAQVHRDPADDLRESTATSAP
jgi:cell division protease FtsH